MDQLIIAVTGIPAIWLVNDQRKAWSRYACLFGLAGQPFWIHNTLVNEQWGMFAMAIVITISWAKGFKANWMGK